MVGDSISQRRIGVLLIHGIGRQERGAFIKQFSEPLNARPIERKDPATDQRPIPAAIIDGANGEAVFLYEVHWDDLISEELEKGSVDVVNLLPLAWFPFFNKQFGLPGFQRFSDQLLSVRSAAMQTLLILFWLGCLGLVAIPHFWDAVEDWLRTDRRAERSRVRREIHDLLRFKRRGWFDRVLDAYVGDVVSYLASISNRSELRGDIAVREYGLRRLSKGENSDRLRSDLERERLNRREIRFLAARIFERFGDAPGAAVNDRCDEIHVVGHSLGSVIAYHAMSVHAYPLTHEISADQAEVTSEANTTIAGLMTIGSPLEKFAHFWPGIVIPMAAAPMIAARTGKGKRTFIRCADDFRWANLYSPADLVSGALESYPRWGEIKNASVPGLGGVITSHVAYRGNPYFVRAFQKQLGLTGRFDKPLLYRMVGRLWAWTQLLILPAVVAFVCALGLATAFAFALPLNIVLSAIYWVGVRVVRWFAPGFIGWNFWLVFVVLDVIIAISALQKTVRLIPRWSRDIAQNAVRRRWNPLYQKRSQSKRAVATTN